MATLDIQLLTPFEGKVDADAGVIRDVSIIQTGMARGHDVFVDRKTLTQVRDAAKGMGKLKAKMNHFSGVEDTVGYYTGFKIREDKLQADLHIFKAYAHRDGLFEMVREDSEQFGISILSDPDTPEEDDEGKFNTRIRKLYSADIVDHPAANRSGMFHEPSVDTGNDDMPKASTPAPADAPPAPEYVTKEAFDAAIAELKESLAKFSAPIESGAPPELTDAALALVPDPAAFAAEVLKEIRLLQAAPPVAATPASAEAKPETVKSYEEAKEEYRAGATGLDRNRKLREFVALHGDKTAYNAKHGLQTA